MIEKRNYMKKGADGKYVKCELDDAQAEAALMVETSHIAFFTEFSKTMKLYDALPVTIKAPKKMCYFLMAFESCKECYMEHVKAGDTYSELAND